MLAALLLALDGCKPQNDVWASCGLDADGALKDVGHLSAKLSLAWEMKVKAIYLKGPENPDIRDWYASHPEARGMWRQLKCESPMTALKESRQLLKPFLAELGIEPDESDQLEVRCHHWNRLTDADTKRDFYCRKIVRDVAERARGKMNFDGAEAIQWLVAFLSKTPELAILSSLIIRPRQCLFLVNGETEKWKPWVTERMECLAGATKIHWRTVDVISLPDPAFVSQICRIVGGSQDSHHVMFDLTPGTKPMSISLADACHKSGGWNFYLQHQLIEGDPDPQTIDPRMWR